MSGIIGVRVTLSMEYNSIACGYLCHAIVGSDQAYHFLTEHGFEADYAERVRQCIRTHRYRKDNPPQNLEAKILFDAERRTYADK